KAARQPRDSQSAGHGMSGAPPLALVQLPTHPAPENHDPSEETHIMERNPNERVFKAVIDYGVCISLQGIGEHKSGKVDPLRYSLERRGEILRKILQYIIVPIYALLPFCDAILMGTIDRCRQHQNQLHKGQKPLPAKTCHCFGLAAGGAENCLDSRGTGRVYHSRTTLCS